ncbi:MAG: hypothetical protein KJ597_07405, partial [Nanoarchaeota archaeon]|nr:hypothetical protein [Nanoarchaeota archaeon]MBU1623371.1 hypothetical protein [Nanoarchaeota archaeon]
MKKITARREARKSASTTTPHPRESGKETAMRHQLMAAIMAVFVFAPATALAQDYSEWPCSRCGQIAA